MTTHVLNVQASGRQSGSITRELSNDVLTQLGRAKVITRDLAQGVPFLDEPWIQANFTPADERTPEQGELLAYSDKLVAELSETDVLLIGAPVYNFGVPAVLKAWIDLIARVGQTFRYSENGPEGLLQDKRAIVVMASGGTAVGSEIDFASGYLRHVLGFVGIKDVTIVAADMLGQASTEKMSAARSSIARLSA